MNNKWGVLIINTGTPDELSITGVTNFLHNFLMDEDIIPMPKLMRYWLVHKKIVPKRASVVLNKYRSINRKNSPLKIIAQNLERLLQQKFNKSDKNIQIKIAMRYSSPSIRQRLDNFKQAGINNILILPLFPQFSRATTLSILKEVSRDKFSQCKFIYTFYKHPLFIKSWVSNIIRHLASDVDLLLFSYHGLPAAYLHQQKYLHKENVLYHLNIPTDCLQQNYKQQCLLTTKLITEELHKHGIDINTTTTFQSRLGRKEWIRPYTDHFLQENGKHFKHILIIPAAFTMDCLETLEELRIEALSYIPTTTRLSVVPSLNTQRMWIDTLYKIITETINKEL